MGICGPSVSQGQSGLRTWIHQVAGPLVSQYHATAICTSSHEVVGEELCGGLVVVSSFGTTLLLRAVLTDVAEVVAIPALHLPFHLTCGESCNSTVESASVSLVLSLVAYWLIELIGLLGLLAYWAYWLLGLTADGCRLTYLLFRSQSGEN